MSEYLVGIDLGTTHTVVAYTRSGIDSADEVQVLPIPQLVAAGEVAARPLLPSVCYLYKTGELDAHDVGLPWLAAHAADSDHGQGILVGEWARELGEKTPGRLVASAKSWLSHSRVDRNAAILPWGDVSHIDRISPVHASACFLNHIRMAWNHQFPDHPLEQQTLVITVPASFDEGARAFTLAAATEAGLGQIKLLEEPQAACYDWLSSHKTLPPESRLLLICDVGGGTTDLTLIAIDQSGVEPELSRIGVGDHLMLGGDNIDLALAHLVESQSDQQQLNYARLSQLLQQTRTAKEVLLRPDAPVSRKVTLLAGGSKLLAGFKSVELQRQQVQELVLQGYFPLVELALKQRSRRSAVVEFGLPYESEAAITRHVADFILRHQEAMANATGRSVDPENPIVPDSLLLNGGVFNAGQIRSQMIAQLESWRAESVTELTGIDPNLAVARGAVFFSLAQIGRSKKIGGGSARSYYLNLGNASNGSDQLVCLLPKGTPEGQPLPLPHREFALVLGNPVRFDLLACTSDTRNKAGDLIAMTADLSMKVLPPLAAVLTEEECADSTQKVSAREARVQLQSELTEVGTLAVTCINPASGQQWLLDFQLRSEPASIPGADSEANGAAHASPPNPERHANLDSALALIDNLYGRATSKPDAKLTRTLRADLEKTLGPRESWDTALLRELFDRLLTGYKQRRRSVAHERLWLNLTGYCLRPGYGADLDEWRVEQLEKLYPQGVIHGGEAQVWSEWWTLWRRIAGGLSEPLQEKLFNDIGYYLHPSVARSRPRLLELQKRAYSEMVRLLGSLEGLSAEQKEQAGDWLLKRLQKASESEQTWWAFGRLGARVPFHGNAHRMLAADTAQVWLDHLLEKNWQKEKTAAFAATLIARHSGDRELDISKACQGRVIGKLNAARCPPSWLQMVSERIELDQADAKRVYGEALPQGLRLL